MLEKRLARTEVMLGRRYAGKEHTFETFCRQAADLYAILLVKNARTKRQTKREHSGGSSARKRRYYSLSVGRFADEGSLRGCGMLRWWGRE